MVFYERFSPDSGDMYTFYKHNPDNYHKLWTYSQEGYLVDGYDKVKGYRFVHRDELDLGVERYKNVHYSLEAPKDGKTWGLSPKLVVYFSFANEVDVNAKKRLFADGKAFSFLSDVVAKNTYILRIADTNLVSGSFYMNTPGWQDYVACVQEVIQKVAGDLGVDHSAIITSGGSRGGTGALLHALVGDYACVANDPIVSRVPFLADDRFLLYDQVPLKFRDAFNQYAKPFGDRKILILSYSALKVTWPFFQGILDARVELREIYLDAPRKDAYDSHGDFTTKNLPQQIAAINDFLYSVDLKNHQRLGFQGLDATRFDVMAPFATRWLAVESQYDYLKITKQAAPGDYKWLGFELRQPLRQGVAYRISLVTQEAHQLILFGHNSREHFEKATKVSKRSGQGGIVTNYFLTPTTDFYLLGISSSMLKTDETIVITQLKIDRQHEKT